jgi:hypothetical protein
MEGKKVSLRLSLRFRMSRLPLTSEFQKFNWRTVVDDHRHPNALRRRVRSGQDFLTLKGGFQIVHLKSDVRYRLDQRVNWAVRGESHPLNAVGTSFEAGDVHLELFQVIFALLWRGGGDSKVMISPAVSGRCRGLFVTEADHWHSRSRFHHTYLFYAAGPANRAGKKPTYAGVEKLRSWQVKHFPGRV